MTILAVAIGFASFLVKIWALVDAFGHADATFRAADRLTRAIWVVVLASALALHLWVGGTAWGGLAGTVVAGIYLADVRPRLRRIEAGPAA